MKYSEKTIRLKAQRIGYTVRKGFQHYLTEGYPVFHNCDGDKVTGYMVMENSTGTYVWGSYNNVFDHLFSLDDVDGFLKCEYESLKLFY